MLEALVRIADGLKDSPKAKGDIVCVKLSPAVWGALEKKLFLIAKIEDPVLEADLIARRNAGEPFPVVSLPYAQREISPQTGTEILKRQSTKFIDISKITKIPKADIDDKTKDKPVLEKTDVTVETRALK